MSTCKYLGKVKGVKDKHFEWDMLLKKNTK